MRWMPRLKRYAPALMIRDQPFAFEELLARVEA